MNTPFAGGWDGDDSEAVRLGGIGGSGHQWSAGDREAKRLQAETNLARYSFEIQGAPTSEENYQKRVAAIIAFARQRGWQAVIQDADGVAETNWFKKTVKYTSQRVVINDLSGPGANLLIEWLHQGNDFTGLIKVESWCRGQFYEEQKQADAKGVKDTQRDQDRRDFEEAKASAPVTRAELDKVNAKLDKLIEAVSQVIGPVA